MPPRKKATPGGGTPGKVPTPMQATGASANTLSGKANHVRIGECFLAHADNAAWGKTWTDVPEAEICTQDFFGSLATYLVSDYKIAEGQKNPGQALAKSTAVQTWSGLIDHTRQRFGKSTSMQTQERLSQHALHPPAAPAHAREHRPRPMLTRRPPLRGRISSSARRPTATSRRSGTPASRRR